MLLDKIKNFDLREFNRELERKNIYKNFCYFIIGLAICQISLSVIYEPYDIVVSGSSGIALLLSKIVDINFSIMSLVVSSLLLILGFIVFGIEYGSRNILVTILGPVFIEAATLINYVVDLKGTSKFLLAVIAGILSGIGTGLIRKSGYSTGGLGVFYDILNIKFKISIGNASMICNTIIMLISIFRFGIDGFIYGFIALYISSVMVDRVLIGISNNKAFYIITNKPLEVKNYITEKLKYTVTIVNARGGYSNKKKKMIMCVVPTIKYSGLKEIVREIDKDAFFLITDCYSVSR